MSKNNQTRTRRKWTVEEKIGIIKKHFGKSRITDTCDEFRVHPNLLNNWLKTILESGASALSGEGRRKSRQQERLTEKYESEMAQKNRIIAELSAEVLDLKKPFGEI